MEEKYVKTPLDYQITEYDCGTTSVLNALRYLFKRKEISPEIYQDILKYTLDESNSQGESGKGGTTSKALESLANNLNKKAKEKGMNLKCTTLRRNDASLANPAISQVLLSGGVAIMRVWQTGEHYILLTKLEEEYAYVFDPYYLEIDYYHQDKACEIIKDRPFEYNRKITKNRLQENTKHDFSLVQGENAEIILMQRMD